MYSASDKAYVSKNFIEAYLKKKEKQKNKKGKVAETEEEEPKQLMKGYESKIKSQKEFIEDVPKKDED